MAEQTDDKRTKDKNWLRRLVTARDELSLRGVRREYLAYTLLFPLAIILSDSLFRQQQATLFGVDSVLVQSGFYGLAWLLTALLPKAAMPTALRIGVWGGALLTVPAIGYSGYGAIGLTLLGAFQFFIGLAAAGGFKHFCFVCNNAERWLAVAIVGIYLGLFWALGSQYYLGDFLRTVPPVVFACGLVFLTFFVRDDAAKTDDARQAKPGASAGNQAVAGYYSVLALAVIYYLIALTNAYLESRQVFLDDRFYGAGMLIGALLAVVLQLILNRSVWHLWNLYLLAAIVGMVIAAFGYGIGSQAGSLLYGFADNLGYLAMLYLLGSVAKMDGRLVFFRWLGVFAFLFGAVVPPVLNLLFRLTDGSVAVLAVIIVCVCLGVYVLLSPVLNRHVFSSDWADSLNALDTVYAEEEKEMAEVDRSEGLNLTERERQVFTLLMTGMARKQIATELKISNPTANFHINNLYRKLDIRSRAELFAKYSSTSKQ